MSDSDGGTSLPIENETTSSKLHDLYIMLYLVEFVFIIICFYVSHVGFI